jgi:hypothetical protein
MRMRLGLDLLIVHNPAFDVDINAFPPLKAATQIFSTGTSLSGTINLTLWRILRQDGDDSVSVSVKSTDGVPQNVAGRHSYHNLNCKRKH